MRNNFNRLFEGIDLAEGFEFMLGEDFDIENLTPTQRTKLLSYCKKQSYDYLALATIISSIVNDYAKTLDDIDVIVAMLSSIINDLLLLRTIRLTCEENITNVSKGNLPASTLVPGFLFSLDEEALTRKHCTTNKTNLPNKKYVKRKKVKKIKKVRKKEV